MGSFLEWYSSHNTTIIQILFGVIGLFILIQLFKIFFGEKETEGKATTSSSVEEKLNKIIENQSKTFAPLAPQVSGSSNTTSEATAEPSASTITDGGLKTSNEEAAQAQSVEIENLRNEVVQLQQTVQEKEQIISQTAAQQNTAARGDTDSAALISQYKKEIEDLKNKLSDFDVIAADIAELPRLREEVKRYQEQQGATTTVATPENTSSTSALESGALDSVLADISEGLGVMADSSTEKNVSTEPITDQEKALINEFEKNKG